MKQFHRITLPLRQALMWREVASGLGLPAMVTETIHADDDRLTVTTKATQVELETAWQLFSEEFNRLIVK